MLDARRIRRLTNPPFGAWLALVVLAAAPAQAQLAVEEIAIVAGNSTDIGGPLWFFFIEVVGENLTGGSVTPPGGGSLPLVDASGQGLELEYEDGPFASFAALQAVHLAGTYTVTLTEGDSVALAWNPTEPLGSAGQPSVTIVQPADGAVGVSSMPSVDFDLDCTNCEDLDLQIMDLATGGMAGSLHFGQLDVAGAFTDPIPFGSMMTGEGAPVPLPDGDYDAELLIALANFSEQGFDPPSSLASFEYIEASALSAQSTFTVPEPARELVTLAALGGLALIAAWSPRRFAAEVGQLQGRTRPLGSGSGRSG